MDKEVLTKAVARKLFFEVMQERKKRSSRHPRTIIFIRSRRRKNSIQNVGDRCQDRALQIGKVIRIESARKQKLVK